MRRTASESAGMPIAHGRGGGMRGCLLIGGFARRSRQRRAGAQCAFLDSRRARHEVAPHLDTEVGRGRFLSAQAWWRSERTARTGCLAGRRVRRRRCMAQLAGRLRDDALVGWLTMVPLPQARHSWQAHALMAVDVAGVDREHRCDRPGDGEPLACERLAPHTLGPRVRPAGRDLLARSWRMANGWQTGWAVRNTGVSGRG